jgi:Tol biopolymer transport system component
MSRRPACVLIGALLSCGAPLGCHGSPSSQLASDAWLRWMPDGRAIAYRDATQANLWVQPLDGKPPHQLTHFTDGRAIVDFAWSRDGKRLAVARSTTSNDIVLFKGLKR